MKTNFYLVVNSIGTVKIYRTKPGLKYDEISIYFSLELPRSLFSKPQITATVTVNEENGTPFTIDAETVNNVKEAIETATGIQVKISMENPA